MLIFLLLITTSHTLENNEHHNHHHHQCNESQDDDKIYAISILQPDNNSGVYGIVKMIQDGNIVTIQATIHNLSDGKHGFHIHQFGNLLKGCITAGPHYNPHKMDHGGPQDGKRHIGDLGNVESKDNIAHFRIEDKLIRLNGEYSVIGRSFVVHANEDDLGKTDHPESKTTGNAGARLACGVIGLSGPFELD